MHKKRGYNSKNTVSMSAKDMRSRTKKYCRVIIIKKAFLMLRLFLRLLY